MALPVYGTNPGSQTPGITGTLNTKPGSVPSIAPSKPMPIVNGQNTQIQQTAQSNLPYTPNNGNPNGAYNSGRRRRAQFGGGYIGARPPEGAVRGANGVWYGSGTMSQQDQEMFQQAQAERERNSFNGQNVLQQLMATLSQARQQNPISMPPAGGNTPVSQPSSPNPGMMYAGGTPGFYGNQQPMFGNNGGLPLGTDPNQPIGPYGYPALNQQAVGVPQLNPNGQNTTTYYGGQNPNLGRYRPPQMTLGGGWSDQGGYSYNLPNAYGPYPNYQTGPYGYGWNYG